MGKKGFGLLKGLGLVAGIGGLVYAGYKATEAINKKLRDEGIIIKVKNIVELLQQDNRVTLNFAALIPEEWKYMYIFTPYTSNTEIFNVMGFEWDEVYQTSINNNEGINLLVFVDNNNNVVRYIEYPIAYGDFNLVNGDIYTNENAVFEITNADGEIKLHDKVREEE